MNVALSPITAADLPIVKSWYLSYPFLQACYYWANRLERTEPANHQWQLARLDAEPVGAVRVRWSKRKNAWVLEELVVAQARQRQGIAAAIFAQLPRPLVFKTDADNASARAFYLAQGCVQTRELTARSGKPMVEFTCAAS